MTIHRALVFIVVAFLAGILAACELSASTPPPSTPDIDGPMATLQSELGMIATQTAAAATNVLPPIPTPIETEGEPPPEETEPPPEPTPEPTEPPAVPTPAPVFTPTPGLPETYTLQRGEFPFCIARRFNVNQNELLSINGLGLDSRPDVGFVLRIPQTGNTFIGQRALRSHPTTYTVSSGDTIHSVACQFGDVDPSAIAQANGIEPPYNLTPGQVLNIP